ncbi:MAG: hypothetical protein OXE84_00680 [Rhodobacteraceae bacterium]|nr:hypothetical protein [Paracoccaceae bacterium]
MLAGKLIGLVSFGDIRYRRSLNRVIEQAHASCFFDFVSVYSELDLPSDYIKRQQGRMTTRVRGFGFWCWKPFVLMETIRRHPEVDIVFYSDAGTHIRREGRARMLQYVGLLDDSKHDILSFCASLSNCILPKEWSPLTGRFNVYKPYEYMEFAWTKGDMFHHFGIDDKGHTHAQTPQLAGGLFALKNTPAIREMLQQWIELTEECPHLFDDEPSVTKNFSGFIEHRHDQSYFSLLAKSKGHVPLSSFECWYPVQHKSDWNILKSSPFQFRRERKKSKIWWRFVKAWKKYQARNL